MFARKQKLEKAYNLFPDSYTNLCL